MISTPEQHVFIVDDEPKMLDVFRETLGSLGVEVTCFVRAAKCYERLRTHRCDLLITDLKMPEMDGTELLANVKRHTPWVSVLVMTGDTDTSTAVRTIKAEAVDLIQKPPDRENLLRTVKSILEKSALINAYAIKPLTWTETKLLRLILDGNDSKEIAHLLNLTVRTIEVHRTYVMQKLGFNNLIDLIIWATRLGLVNPQVNRKSTLVKDGIRKGSCRSI